MIKRLICLILITFSSAIVFGQKNIALNKKYIISEPPNYGAWDMQSISGALTDGLFTKGHFWTQSSTYGWQAKSKINITIDLEKNNDIGSIRFNTARGKTADVYFPDHIYAFISDDNQNFIYVGDLTSGLDKAGGEYLVKKLTLNNINQSGRYVKLSVISNGFYLFTDEIEVIQGKSNTSKVKLKTISYRDLDKETYLLMNFENLLKSTREDLESVAKNEPGGFNITLNKLRDELNSKSLNPESLTSIKKKIKFYHGKILKKLYGKNIIIEKVNPWESYKELHQPQVKNFALNSDYILSANGVHYDAFMVTNANSTIEHFSLKVSEGNDNSMLRIFKVEFIASKDHKMVLDPLIPVTGGLKLLPGESQLFIYELMGERAGKNASTVSIISSQGDIKINISSTIKDVFSSPGLSNLNAVNWGYLNYDMISNATNAAIKDQISHHINTIVVPSHIMPRPGDYNFKDLIHYIDNYTDVKNILLFSNYSHTANNHLNGNLTFLSDEWKLSFNAWYVSLLKEIKKRTSANIYLYPFDEVEDQDVNKFINFSKWARLHVKGLKVFATFHKLKTVDQLIQYVDVAQVLRELNYRKLPGIKAEVWIYSTKNNSRALSPYTYYRLMAWDAYFKDYHGIGFWNYADIGQDEKFNFIQNNYLNWKDDYAVIYNQTENSILSSRRWEAFRLGLEDYRLLCLYEKRFGVVKAKNLAAKVLNNSESLHDADLVRMQILKAL